MSFKEFSSAHSASAKNKPGDKSNDAPTVDQPAVWPEKTPSEVVPARKS
jgi:hypothetical protein